MQMQQLQLHVRPRASVQAMNSLDNLEAVTKVLSLMRVAKDSDKRKFVLSSNIPLLMGFAIGGNLKVEVIGCNKGIRITPSDAKADKIMSFREYTRARVNVLKEAVYDDRNQTRLDEGLGNAKRVRVIMRYAEITILPIIEAELNIDEEQPLTAMAVCTAGVDIQSIERAGMAVEAILETRPPEKRDLQAGNNPETGERGFKHVDKTETGVLSCLLNSTNIRYVANEDIYLADFQLLANLFDAKRYHFCSLSLQCDDVSKLKAKILKDKSVDSLETTVDMFIPALEMIKQFQFPTIMIENVEEFDEHPSGIFFKLQLRRLGYNVHSNVLSARDYNGYTRRTRSFIFATKIDAPFAWPTPQARTVNLWEDLIKDRLSEMRIVTDNKAVKDAVITKRSRFTKIGADVGYTIAKSQARMTKDSVYFKVGDDIYMPSVEQLAEMMSITNMDLSIFSDELKTEIIGQSVDLDMHDLLMQSVTEHIAQGRRAGFKLYQRAPSEIEERMDNMYYPKYAKAS